LDSNILSPVLIDSATALDSNILSPVLIDNATALDSNILSPVLIDNATALDTLYPGKGKEQSMVTKEYVLERMLASQPPQHLQRPNNQSFVREKILK
jgi:hypothetical protein